MKLTSIKVDPEGASVNGMILYSFGDAVEVGDLNGKTVDVPTTMGTVTFTINTSGAADSGLNINAVASTDDHVYGESNALWLASTNPRKLSAL